MSSESAREFVARLRDEASPEAEEWRAALEAAREDFVAGKDFSADELVEALREEAGVIIFSEPPGL